jgi:hypothetical protein
MLGPLAPLIVVGLTDSINFPNTASRSGTCSRLKRRD